jgi:hypothetical protein
MNDNYDIPYEDLCKEVEIKDWGPKIPTLNIPFILELPSLVTERIYEKITNEVAKYPYNVYVEVSIDKHSKVNASNKCLLRRNKPAIDEYAFNYIHGYHTMPIYKRWEAYEFMESKLSILLRQQTIRLEKLVNDLNLELRVLADKKAIDKLNNWKKYAR